MKKKEKIAIMLVAGAAISAGLVYFFTSNEGRKIRKKVMEKGKQIVDELKDTAEKLKCREEKSEAVS